jgi:hypothetical protein
MWAMTRLRRSTRENRPRLVLAGLVAWEVVVISSLWWFPPEARTGETAFFVGWFWAIFGPPLVVAAHAGRSRDSRPRLRSRPELSKAGLGMLIIWGIVGVVGLAIDVEAAQVFLFLAAVGAVIVYVRWPIDFAAAPAPPRHSEHGRVTTRRPPPE